MDAEITPYRCSVVTGEAGFAALRAEWNALHAATKTAHLSEAFDWVRLCWERFAAPRGKRLYCLTVRRGSQLAAIWPLAVGDLGFLRVGAPLTSETEYCPFLIDPAADLNGVWSAIRAELAQRRDLDALRLPDVRDDGALTDCLEHAPRSVSVRERPAPLMRRADSESWESYWGRLPHKVTANVSRNQRRLQRLGQVQFEDLSDPEERQVAWKWAVSKKRAWLVQKGLGSQFISSDDHARFVAATLDVFGPSGQRRMFTLKLDGRLVAAELVSVDRARVEMFVTTYDPDFTQCAPGNLLRAEVLRWAFERGLDYDFRSGEDAYKFEWATHIAHTTYYALALTAQGRLFIAYAKARNWVAKRMTQRLRSKVAGLLRRALPA
jgi:CelD/BcsL family acetyltransferase involved in cellulose biosynthesis